MNYSTIQEIKNHLQELQSVINPTRNNLQLQEWLKEKIVYRTQKRLDMQKVYQAITGYNPRGITGAKDDYYYACENEQEKINQIIAYAENGMDIFLTEEEAIELYNAIEEGNAASASDHYHIYDAIGPQ